MRLTFTRFFMGVCFTLCASLPVQAANKLTIDDQHSYVLWHINHLGYSTQTGKWFVKGTVVLDKEKPQSSKVEVVIPLATFNTGIPELDDHLKGKLFFDVKQFPVATFVSDKVEVNGQNTATVHGMLSLHGVTKPVTLAVTLNKSGKNLLNDRMTVGFSATTQLKRSDFGMNALLPSLGDEVKIEIAAEAYLPNAQGENNAPKKQ